MTRYKLTIEYDGTNLIGWQENQQGPSVQSLLQDAIYKFCGEHTDVVAAGRTDAGVHAIGMVAHVDISKSDDDIAAALNFWLTNMGAPVAVLKSEIVHDDFHARFDCIRRNYRYVIINRRAPLILEKNRAWWIPKPLDIDAMRVAATSLVGNHDFTSFRASECQAKSPIKTLDTVEITTDGNRINIDFSARSFLHRQVRNMVGTLAEIGLGKPMNIDDIFDAKNRSAAGIAAPSSGLYFVSADY